MASARVDYEFIRQKIHKKRKLRIPWRKTQDRVQTHSEPYSIFCLPPEYFLDLLQKSFFCRWIHLHAEWLFQIRYRFLGHWSLGPFEIIRCRTSTPVLWHSALTLGFPLSCVCEWGVCRLHGDPLSITNTRRSVRPKAIAHESPETFSLLRRKFPIANLFLYLNL